MIKKFASLLLTICMVIGLISLPTNVVAATSGNYTYTVSNGKATITYFDSIVKGAITIPSTLGGYPVTTISKRAFADCDGLTSVTIPTGVLKIEEYAFCGCDVLKSISIPESVTAIGNYAFYGCLNLQSIYWNAKNINDFSELNYIFSYTGNTSDGINVIFGNSVKSIPKYAFGDCKSLKRITFGSSIVEIRARAFCGCDSLTEILLPGNITSIGEYAFAFCDNLSSVSLSSGLTSISNSIFSDCVKLTSIIIPNSVTSIEDMAFYGCTGLSTITIPKSVTSIGNRAFYKCNLKYIYFDGFPGEFNEIDIGEDNGFLSNYYVTYLKFKVNYNANGGSGAPPMQTKKRGEPLALSDIKPNRIGYIFKNWSTSSGGGTSYNSGDKYIQESNVTLYAQWTPITYSVKYNGNGSTSGSMSNSSHTYDVSKNLTANGFSKTGYSFKGWSKDPTGTVSYSNSQSVKNLTTVNGSTFNLYAIWEPTSYTVNFDANKGSTATTSKNVTYNSTYGILPIPERTGWKFEGWYTDLTGGTQITYDTKVTITSAQTLYARWEPNSPCTSSTISTSGTTHTINTEVYKINSDAYMFAAGYESGKLIAIDSGVYNNNNMEFILEGYIDEVKVMTWDDISTMRPLCGAEIIPVTPIIESSHPYDNDCNETKTYVYSGECKSIDVTFSSDTFVENNYDKIYILDGNDNQIGVYTGSALAGVTINIPGNTVKIKLTSDSSVTKYGYKVDKIVVNR